MSRTRSPEPGGEAVILDLSWPVAIYDVLGILVPGVLGLLVGEWFVGVSAAALWSNALLALPVAYSAGHLVQAMGRALFAGLDRLCPSKEMWWDQGSALRAALVEGVARHYGKSVGGSNATAYLFDLCYSAIPGVVGVE